MCYVFGDKDGTLGRMKTHPLTSNNWLFVALAAVVIGILFFWQYMSVIALAALMAFLFNGAFQRLSRKMRPGAAATLTFLFSVALVVIPIGIVAIFAGIQLSQLVVSLTTSFGGSVASLPAPIQEFINFANSTVQLFTGGEQALTTGSVLEFLRNTLPNLIRGFLGFLTSFIGSIPIMIILAMIYVVLFYEFLVYGKKIIQTIVALSPFQPDVTRLYLARIGLMANAMAKGQLLISFVIAVLSAIVLAACLNLWHYLVLMVVVFTLFNLVPLGSGIIIYPMTIIAMVFGAFWPGLIALILYTLISNLDAVIRPKIVPRSITLSPGLTLLAAFAGITFFGLLGVVYGPIIVIAVVTSVQMYMDYYQKQPAWRKKATS
ncbi:AI-2E family transporter [Candidatus Saccharibacteria bacterium]|nr:AI-2E family transporter [Candidatus Saccharibacteria bacterium]